MSSWSDKEFSNKMHVVYAADMKRRRKEEKEDKLLLPLSESTGVKTQEVSEYLRRGMEYIENADALRKSFAGLTSREREVLALYFGLFGQKEHTLEEVGTVLRVTRERVRSIRESALRKLRNGRFCFKQNYGG